MQLDTHILSIVAANAAGHRRCARRRKSFPEKSTALFLNGVKLVLNCVINCLSHAAGDSAAAGCALIRVVYGSCEEDGRFVPRAFVLGYRHPKWHIERRNCLIIRLLIFSLRTYFMAINTKSPLLWTAVGAGQLMRTTNVVYAFYIVHFIGCSKTTCHTSWRDGLRTCCATASRHASREFSAAGVQPISQ